VVSDAPYRAGAVTMLVLMHRPHAAPAHGEARAAVERGSSQQPGQGGGGMHHPLSDCVIVDGAANRSAF
jgi:hypothetical protein